MKMNNIPNLDNVISAMECEGTFKNLCKHCPYDYQYWDDSGDYGFWWCDENKVWGHALFYLKLYQYLIKEKNNA